MGIKQQHGFTIVELSLFLGISALVIVTLLTATTFSIQRQRFTDSVNGSQAFLQQQYNEVDVTLNNRSDKVCSAAESLASKRGASKCVIVGKIIDLNPPINTNASTNPNKEHYIRSYYVIGDIPVDADGYDINNITTLDPNFNLTAISADDSNQQFIIPWGAVFTDQSVRDSGGSINRTGTTLVNYLLILRSPKTGLVQTLKYVGTTPLFNGADVVRALSPTDIREFDNADDDPSVKACMQSADIVTATALLKIQPLGSQDAVTTQFDGVEVEGWCV